MLTRLQHKQTYNQKGTLSLKQVKQHLTCFYPTIKGQLGSKIAKKLFRNTVCLGLTRNQSFLIESKLQTSEGLYILIGTDDYLILELWEGDNKMRLLDLE